jgi:crotonobetainyl-CoA:carnitine CoA-transferase CaiB-like acyl-CoA transferase
MCIVPALTFDEAVKETIARHTGILEYVEFPGVGKVLQTNLPFKFSELKHDLQSATPPPVLGQHTTQILEQIGYAKEEIVSLLEAGVVTQGS